MSVEVPENFLDMVKRTARDCRIPGTGPSTVVSQTGMNQNLVSWVAEAWVEIQNLHKDWRFLRLSASFTTVAGTALYTLGTGTGTVGLAASAFGRWVRKSFRLYTTSVGTNDEQHLGYREYDSWRDLYLMGSNRNARTRPSEYTVNPAYSIGLGPVPAAGYTVTGDYFRKAVKLALDADIPACPSEYFMLIVYEAIKKYGARENVTRLYQYGAAQANLMLPQMEAECLPEIKIGGALC